MEFRVMDPAVPPASELLEAMIVDLIPLYGRIDVEGAPSARPEDLAACLVGFSDDGEPVCAGVLKELEPGVVEIKRMFVVHAARGRGLAKELLRALEDEARARGYERVRLDTGPKQPHAERMYRAAGYAEIENFNGNPFASFFGEKSLAD